MNKKDYVKEFIKSSVADGKYIPGIPLPSVRRFSKMLSCSEITVRNAVKELCGEGLLYSLQGSGTYVKSSEKCKKKILILYHYQLKYNIHKKAMVLIGKLKKYFEDRNYIPIIYPDTNENISPFLSENCDDIAGAVSVCAFRQNLNRVVQAKIPLVETNALSPSAFPTVQYDYIRLYNLYDYIFQNYERERVVIFNYFVSVRHNHSTFAIRYAINKNFEKYNLHLFTENEMYEMYHRKFRSVMKGLSLPPQAMVFFDENIYEICRPLLADFGDFLKDTQIYSHYTGDFEADTDFRIIKIGFDMDLCVEKTGDLLFKIMKGEFVSEYIVSIPPEIKEN